MLELLALHWHCITATKEASSALIHRPNTGSVERQVQTVAKATRPPTYEKFWA